MNKSNSDGDVKFRFTQLNKLQAFTLEREIVGASFEERSDNAEHKYYIGLVPLTHSNLDDINDFYVRQRVALEASDILVSVESDSGEKTLTVPDIVNRMLKYIDCKLSFSFTVL